jgi:hypothetical protein
VDATGIQEQAQKSTTRLQISEDAIAEYRVDSALYDAEHGSQAGAQVDVVTKSGTNQFHGSVFGYLRNSVFDAREFIDPVPIPAFRLGQFGGTFGGPIKKNKAFFFLSYEGLRQLQNVTTVAAVPDPLLQAAILTQSPVLCQILQAFPWRQSAVSHLPSSLQIPRESILLTAHLPQLSTRTVGWRASITRFQRTRHSTSGRNVTSLPPVVPLAMLWIGRVSSTTPPITSQRCNTLSHLHCLTRSSSELIDRHSIIRKFAFFLSP